MKEKKPTTLVRRPAALSWAARGNWFAGHPRLTAFLLGLVAMWWIQSASYEPSGRDSFYHIKMAVLLPKIGFVKNFHWLRHTVMNENHVSHHTGFHMLMVPFVYASKWTSELIPNSVVSWAEKPAESRVGQLVRRALTDWHDEPYILGAKVLDTLLFGALAAMVMQLLIRLEAGLRWFWLLAFFALPWEFYLRMSYIRAPLPCLVLMLLICHACLTRRPFWVGIYGLIAGHIYLGALVFYPIVVGAFVVGKLITGDSRKAIGLLLSCAVLGMLLGLVTHPFFPESVEFLKLQILKSGLQVADINSVAVGLEWKAPDPKKFLMISGFILALAGFTLALRLNLAVVKKPGVLPLLLLNVFFLILCLRHRRFIEYWPVFALLSSAALWTGIEEQVQAFQKSISKDSENLAKLITFVWDRLYIAICIMAIAISGFSLAQTRRVARSPFDRESIKPAMQFLKTQTPEGSLVFADDWDVFPPFFYYNDHNHYVCGLDPQFTNSMDPELWERYCVITQGRSPRNSTVTIRTRTAGGQIQDRKKEFRVQLTDIAAEFQADYVIVDQDHARFYRQLLRDREHFSLIYPPSDARPAEQPKLTIFKVLKPTIIDDSPPVSRETSNNTTHKSFN